MSKQKTTGGNVAKSQQSDEEVPQIPGPSPISEDETAARPVSAIFGSVAAVMRALAAEGIGKNSKNVQQGYQFRGIDDILNILATLFVKNNIIVRPRYGDRTLSEYTSKAGTRMASVTVAGVFQLVSTIDSSALEFGPFYGEGMDSGDKATNKAMAVCFKYFATQSFVIPFIGNDDPDLESHEVQSQAAAGAKPVAAAPQAGPETIPAAIARLVPAGPARKKLTDLISKAYGVVLPEQVPDDKRAEAIAKLETYVAKQAEAAKAKLAA